MPKRIDFPAVISRLKDFYESRKRLPSFSEIQSLFGYRSKGGVSLLTNHLVKRGILKRDSKVSLCQLLLLRAGSNSRDRAGRFSVSRRGRADRHALLDEFLIKNPRASYLVKVTGDSMVDAGIMPDDLVIVERGRQAATGIL